MFISSPPERNTEMTYQTRKEAQDAANIANRVYNYGGYFSRPIQTAKGWVVITTGD